MACTALMLLLLSPRYVGQVESEARKEELDVFMAVIAPTFSSTSMQLGTTRTRHAEKLPITYDSSSIACLILRHATGPLSKQIFFHESVSRATEKMSCTAIAEMVKREELQRQVMISMVFSFCGCVRLACACDNSKAMRGSHIRTSDIGMGCRPRLPGRRPTPILWRDFLQSWACQSTCRCCSRVDMIWTHLREAHSLERPF